MTTPRKTINLTETLIYTTFRIICTQWDLEVVEYILTLKNTMQQSRLWYHRNLYSVAILTKRHLYASYSLIINDFSYDYRDLSFISEVWMCLLGYH